MALSKEARERLGIATTDFNIGNEIADLLDLIDQQQELIEAQAAQIADLTSRVEALEP